MKSESTTLRRILASSSGANQVDEKQKQPTIKPLASAARAYNDDAADCKATGTIQKVRDGFHFQTRNLANLRWMIATLTFTMLVSQQCISSVRGAGFSLDFSPRGTDSGQVNLHDPSARLVQELSADYSSEFAETSSLLMHMKEALEEYGRNEKLEPINEEVKVHLVSANLVRLGVNLADEPHVQRIASQLDFMMVTFWNEFLPLIQRIVTEKPHELNPGIDLAFRCSRYPELMALYKLSTQSTLYSLVWQVFTSELYVHCVRRKLATVDLTQVKPSSTVKQFVDIYIGFPVHYSAMSSRNKLSEEERNYVSRLLTTAGLQFNLERALAINGPLEAAANLVFTENSPLSLGNSDTSSSSQRQVQRFRVECQDLIGKLGKIWGDMDEVAGFMSSPMSDLREFANRIKMASPQLIYGSVCAQLIQTIKD